MKARASGALAFGDVATDDLGGHGAGGAGVVGLGPKLPAAAQTFQMRELFAQVARGMALEQVGDLGGTEARRRGDKDMDVVLVRFDL